MGTNKKYSIFVAFINLGDCIMTTNTIKRFGKESKNIRIIRESVITGILVFLLLGLISPFDVEQLGDRRLGYFFLISLATILSCFMVGLFTTYVLKKPLDPKLPLRTVHRNSLILLLVNTPVLAAILTTLNGVYNCDHALDIWYYGGHFTLVPYTYFLYYIGSSSLFIFIGTYIRNKNWQLHEQLEEMRSINKLLEEHQKDLELEEPRVCHLIGFTNDSCLDVVAKDILYVESMANYATIWYLSDNTPAHKMLRITLKQIKEQLCDLPYMVQCHRAFIVNLNFVVNMSSRNNGYQLQLFGIDKLIPVSRTYTPLIKEKLQKNN